jgi:hypothetical protein
MFRMMRNDVQQTLIEGLQNAVRMGIIQNREYFQMPTGASGWLGCGAADPSMLYHFSPLYTSILYHDLTAIHSNDITKLQYGLLIVFVTPHPKG